MRHQMQKPINCAITGFYCALLFPFLSSFPAIAIVKEKSTSTDHLTGMANKVRFENVKKADTILAPDFSASTIDGSAFHLTDLRGRFVLLDFWGTWCAPCMEDIPVIKKFAAKHTNALETVSICCHDNIQDWNQAVREQGMSWIQILNVEDNDHLLKKYRVSQFPTKILIDPNGKIVWRMEGYFFDAEDEIFEQIDDVIKKYKNK